MAYKIFNNPKTRFALIFQVGLIALVSFALLRVAFFVRAWTLMDHNLLESVRIFSLGLIYDLAFISFFSIPFVAVLTVLPNKWLNSQIFKGLGQVTVFGVLYGLFFSMVAEWLFWNEFEVRFNFIAVDYLVYRREVTDNIMESYPVFWLLGTIFIVTAFVFILVRKPFLKALIVPESFCQRLSIAFCLMMIPATSMLFLDQSQRSFFNNNYVTELASNGPYQLFAAFRNNTLDYKQFYETGADLALSKKLKEQILQPNSHYQNKELYNIARHIDANGPPKKLNVILITIESLSAKFLTRFGNKQNITPFMDDWFKQGMLFTNFYATGTRTVRGLEAITLSIPPTPGRSVLKRPDNGRMYSLGKVFKDKGYDIAFLYGGRGYFDNMNSFFSKNGYRIVDQTSLNDKEISFKNAWGVCDEDLFNRAIHEANKVYDTNSPFFFHIMTTSNHQPFTYPQGKIDLSPGEGQGRSGRAGGVKYTDYALSQMIKKAKEQPWFDNTIFVVVADHCAASAGKVGLPVKKYHIPLFFYAPKHIKPQEIDRLSCQIDLAPTLLSLLDFSYDSFFFGGNILAPDFKGRALIANYQKLGLFNGKELLILSPGKSICMVDTKSNDPIIRKIDASYPFVEELISFYQGADYILRNRLNKWSEDIVITRNHKVYTRKKI